MTEVGESLCHGTLQMKHTSIHSCATQIAKVFGMAQSTIHAIVKRGDRWDMITFT